MVHVSRYQIPSVGLILIGIHFARERILRYLDYAADPPSHPIGALAEVVTVVSLGVAAVLVEIGIWGLIHDRSILPVAVLAGVASLIGSLAINLYSIPGSFRLVLALGVIVAVAPALAVGVVLHRTTFWTG